MSVSSAINKRDISRDIFSASIGSVCCCYVGQPLDTIKVRMQTNPTIYSSIIQTTTSTVRNEGLNALWKGSVPTALGMIAENAVAFGVNEFLKRAFPDPNKSDGDDGPPDLLRPFVMGSITGCFSATVLLPSEVIKAKTQVRVGTSHSSMDIVKEMIRKQGVKVCVGVLIYIHSFTYCTKFILVISMWFRRTVSKRCIILRILLRRVRIKLLPLPNLHTIYAR